MSVTTQDMLDLIARISGRIDNISIDKINHSSYTSRNIIGSSLYLIKDNSGENCIKLKCLYCGDEHYKPIISYKKEINFGVLKSYIACECRECISTYEIVAIRDVIIECEHTFNYFHKVTK